jgi:hypothetical protein
MFKVTLSSGQFLECTDYHTWKIQSGKTLRRNSQDVVKISAESPIVRDVMTKDLKIGMKLPKCLYPVIEFSKSLPFAYELGLFAGDGYVLQKSNTHEILLYGKKKELFSYLHKDAKATYYDEKRDRLFVTFEPMLKNFDSELVKLFTKTFVPVHYNLDTRLKWLAGIIDTDGTLYKGLTCTHVQITSIDREFLGNIQRMLYTMGVLSKIVVNNLADFRKMPDGKGGLKEYFCQTTHRLTISSRFVDLLVRLGLKTHRVILDKYVNRTQRFAERHSVITKIERIPNAEKVYCFNEPHQHTGVFNGILTGQCFEQVLESTEICNLVETYPSHADSYEEYEETLKYAYLWAKTVTLTKTMWPETNQVMLKNRRIGISQSGIIDAFVKHGRRNMMDWNNKGYAYIKKLDQIYSDWLCIPRSKRVSSTKPSGSVSLLAGVSPGIHYPHAEYYIRRIRIAANSPLASILKDANYHWEYEIAGITEEARKATLVFEFPVHVENFEKSKEDATIWEQVKNAVDIQKTWSDNSVSITVTFKESEKGDISRVLEAYEDSLKAISFLPFMPTAYKLPPYETITREKYEEMWRDIKPIDFKKINLYSPPEGEKFCSNDSCELPAAGKKSFGSDDDTEAIKDSVYSSQREVEERFCDSDSCELPQAKAQESAP